MHKLTLMLNNGNHKICLDGFIITHVESKITIKNAAIYWNFNSVLSSYNNTLGNITFDEGYWTFDMI